MLVVIAVMAVLIAVLLPALMKSMDTANVATCNTNLANLMKGELAYTMDHDQRFTISTRWVWSAGKYPDGTMPATSTGYSELTDPTILKNIEQGDLWDYHSELEAFVCPVAIENLPRQSWWKNEALLRSYSQNGEAGEAAVQEWHDKGWSEEKQVETISRPSDFVFFAEENTFSIYGWNSFNDNGMNDALFRLQPYDYDQFGSFHNTSKELNNPVSGKYYSPSDPLCSGIYFAAMADGHVEEVNYKGKIVGGPFNNVKWSRMWCKDSIPVTRP